MSTQRISQSRHEFAAPVPLGRPSGSRQHGFRRAFARVGRNVRTHLSNLAILVELHDAYTQARTPNAGCGEAALLPSPLGRLIDDMIERAHQTGDPLACRDGITDVSTIVGRALQLNAPLAATLQLRVQSDMLAPLVVAGDARLLAEAMASLVAILLRESVDGADVTAMVDLRAEHAVIEFTSRCRSGAMARLARHLHPFAQGRSQGANSIPDDLSPWLARIAVERHDGTVDLIASEAGNTRLVVALPSRLL